VPSATSRVFVAWCEVCKWPFATVTDVRSNVGNKGMTGLVMLIASLVDPDPSETLVAHFCSDAQHSTERRDVVGFPP
jgi:hypothetical protein